MNESAVDLVGINKDKEPLSLSFFNDLDYPAGSDDKGHKSKCPSCEEGLLLMHRGVDGRLLAHDMCTLCAQRIVYLDIELVRSTRP